MPSDFRAEEQRIRETYAERDGAGKGELYAWHRPDVAINLYRLNAVMAKVLAADAPDLSKLEILDVGCGSGGWLRRLKEWGVSPARLHGIDLLADRIDRALRLAPDVDFRCVSAWPLPYGDRSMDLVFALTVFSSILDDAAREHLASEMVRVMRDGGKIMLFDFRISNPQNPDTRGVPERVVKTLFRGLECTSRSLILLPPLARRIAPISPLAALALEAAFPFLRSHAVYVLRRRAEK